MTYNRGLHVAVMAALNTTRGAIVGNGGSGSVLLATKFKTHLKCISVICIHRENFCLEVRTAQPSFSRCLRLRLRLLLFVIAMGKFAMPSNPAASASKSVAKNAVGKKLAAGAKKAPWKKPAAVNFEDLTFYALRASPVPARKFTTPSKLNFSTMTVQVQVFSKNANRRLFARGAFNCSTRDTPVGHVQNEREFGIAQRNEHRAV